jgi:hypothetical protein
MSYSSIIGSLGVSLLLIAFFLSLFRYISQENRAYMLLNVTGAALSCYASVLIGYIPFVILEAVWCLVAMVALIRSVGAPTSAGPSDRKG